MGRVIIGILLLAYATWALTNPWSGLLSYFIIGAMIWFLLDFVMGMHRGWKVVFLWLPQTIYSIIML